MEGSLAIFIKDLKFFIPRGLVILPPKETLRDKDKDICIRTFTHLFLKSKDWQQPEYPLAGN